MPDYIVKVENVSKRYTIRHQNGSGNGFRHAIEDFIRVPLRWQRQIGSNGRKNNPQPSSEYFWALKDVSFEVKRGEVIGIIGRNGAGKSTFLKILSRITEPTEGRIRVRGRVASLLEVGTGFHPELTGRENIYLNGSILGMTRAEIKRRFDDIVAFADIEKFLDTPVKWYSSGMYVRLAFAVAAHLEPEILVVDEVLAVGDAEFQEKCVGKMQEVASHNRRTVFFVSHNLSAILSLCSKALLFDKGRIIAIGDAKEVCDRYVENVRATQGERRSGKFLDAVILLDEKGSEISAVTEDQPLRFQCELEVPEENCQISLIVKDQHNNSLCELCDYSFSPPRYNDRNTSVFVETRSLPLLAGRYSVSFWLGNRFGHRIELMEGALYFDIVASEKTDNLFALQGALRWRSKWEAK